MEKTLADNVTNILAVLCFIDLIENWHKIIKHTQKILQLLPTNCLGVFDHFVIIKLKENIFQHLDNNRNCFVIIDLKYVSDIFIFHSSVINIHWIFEEHFFKLHQTF